MAYGKGYGILFQEGGKPSWFLLGRIILFPLNVSHCKIPFVYPREFRFTSEVPIRLDYHGKHVSMDQVCV